VSAAGIGLSMLWLAVMAAGFTAGVWWVRRHRGPRGAVVAWLAATVATCVIFTAIALFRVSQVRPPTSRDMFESAVLYLVMEAVGFGAITWRVNRRLRIEPDSPLNASALLSGCFTYFAAGFVLLLPVLLRDCVRFINTGGG